MSVAPAQKAEVAIEAIDVSKRYGAAYALADVSVSWLAGDVHAIAGENGAGKSTLVKIISGVIGAGDYDGTIRIDGEPVRFAGVRDAERAGVFLVPQELNIVPEISVADYLYLNREPQHRGVIDLHQLLADTARWLETFRLPISPLTKMGELRSHEQQLVSIARAMTQGVRILILDEPTASLTAQETELLFERVRAFRDLGVTTLYISHRLAEFEAIADAVTVMRDGRIVDVFRIADEPHPPQRVVRAMVGRDLSELYPKETRTPGEVRLSLENWTVGSPAAKRRDPVRDVSLSVRAGEVLGIFGLVGSGSSDLARSLFGAHKGKVSGTVKIGGDPVLLRTPREAMAVGIAYLPSDRKRDGLVAGMSVAANLTLASLGNLIGGGMIDRRSELTSVRQYVDALRIKVASVEQPVGDLSGGNQQKVVAAKWLRSDPDIIVFEEPTRGVDVGARVEIYNLINDIARQGKAVIIVSTDLPEIIGMSDRVIAMRDGTVAGEWSSGPFREADIMLAAAGSSGV
ncbi:D-xylose transport system ATP-binding protein [Rhodobium orientis]|nr:sugar ABC transporter ATP-binding protein [Rhodobium orientis]MBB4301653.1 D-xylose transport system ATP-binding protein [Rhodobium orientis]